LLGLEFIYWRLILYRSLELSLLDFIKNEIEKIFLYFEIRWFCGLELSLFHCTKNELEKIVLYFAKLPPAGSVERS
jgi:hypothetical protein